MMATASMEIRSRLPLGDLGRVVGAASGVALRPYLGSLIGDDGICSTVVHPEGDGKYTVLSDAEAPDDACLAHMRDHTRRLRDALASQPGIELMTFKDVETIG